MPALIPFIRDGLPGTKFIYIADDQTVAELPAISKRTTSTSRAKRIPEAKTLHPQGMASAGRFLIPQRKPNRSDNSSPMPPKPVFAASVSPSK